MITWRDYYAISEDLKVEAALDPENRDKLLRASRIANQMCGFFSQARQPLPSHEDLRIIADYVEQMLREEQAEAA